MPDMVRKMMTPRCFSDRSLSIGFLWLAIGCGAASAPGRDGGAGDRPLPELPSERDAGADVGAAGDGGHVRDAGPAACRFAREGDPSAMKGEIDLVADASERLAAPPGGLWRLPVTTSGGETIAARDEAGGVVELEVLPRAGFQLTQAVPLIVLRVPRALASGRRLQIGGRTLLVTTPAGPLDLDRVVVTRADRPALGGTGIVVRVPPGTSDRVLIRAAYIVHPSGNLRLGVQVLEEITVADAARACAAANGSPPSDPDEVFIPLWAGKRLNSLGLPADGIGLVLGDVDEEDVDRFRFVRLPP